MGRQETLEAIVIKTYDVGEADRFCILLTKERGKIAARARGVRKLTSRMGGSLLPMQHISIEIHNGTNGTLITAAHRNETNTVPKDIHTFDAMQHIVELLLVLLADEEEVPEIFGLMQTYLQGSKDDLQQQTLPFSIRLLTLMGIFPPPKTLPGTYANEEHVYCATCMSAQWQTPPVITRKQQGHIEELVSTIVEEHIGKRLQSNGSRTK